MKNPLPVLISGMAGARSTCLALVCLLLTCSSAHALPGPGRGLKRWLREHRELLVQAQGVSSASSLAPNAVEPVSWSRLWRELRQTQRLQLIVPATGLSLLLTGTELVVPRLRGELFDAVLLPGATLSALWPKLRQLALLALSAWMLSIVSSVLFAQARWTAAMATRVRLMDAVLEQEPAYYDEQQPGELSSRLLSEPDRLEALANRGVERGLAALVSVLGSFAMMAVLDWRLALIAVALRAPLVGKLAEAAGRTVGLLSMMQQKALNEANALASEALAQPHAVAAHAARGSVLEEYGRRVADYMAIIRATLVGEAHSQPQPQLKPQPQPQPQP